MKERAWIACFCSEHGRLIPKNMKNNFFTVCDCALDQHGHLNGTVFYTTAAATLTGVEDQN